MGARVKIIGTGMLATNCGILAIKTQEVVEQVLKEFGFTVANDAKRLCPVVTGRLRSSLTVNWSKSPHNRAPIKNPSKAANNPSQADDAVGRPPDPKGFQVAVGTNVVYAESVHRRLPYFDAAWASNEAKFKAKLTWALKGGMKI